MSKSVKTLQLNHLPSGQDNVVVGFVVVLVGGVLLVLVVVERVVSSSVGLIPVCAPSFQDYRDDDVLDVDVLGVDVVYACVYGTAGNDL